jgi:nitroreductase
LQPWKAYVIQNQELKTKLRAASWNQPQVEECSHFVVLTGKTEMKESYINDYIERTSKLRNIPKESLNAYKEMMVGSLIKGPVGAHIPEWSAKQAYIVLGNILMTAALIGVDACPMEGIDPQKYDEILKLGDTGYHTIVACAFGYRSDEDPFSKMAKVRLDKKDVIVNL